MNRKNAAESAAEVSTARMALRREYIDLWNATDLPGTGPEVIAAAEALRTTDRALGRAMDALGAYIARLDIEGGR